MFLFFFWIFLFSSQKKNIILRVFMYKKNTIGVRRWGLGGGGGAMVGVLDG